MSGGSSPPAPALRVAIVGAGPAGLATAWGLTSTLPGGSPPNVDVTVYEQSWRAGGKCASTRLPPSYRIVQNGTHYMFGVYFNTLAMVEKAHGEIQDARFGDVSEFVARPLIAFKHLHGGAWHNWKFNLPMRGQAFPQTGAFQSPEQYLIGVLQALRQRLVDDGILPSLPVLQVLFEFVIQRAADFVSDPSNAMFVASLDKALVALRAAAHALLKGNTGLASIQARMLIDLVLTEVLGILRDDVLAGQIAALDAWDFAEWLAHHGAQPETCSSPLVKASYDSVAAYENGDVTKPRLSAAAVLQTIVPALVAYQGAFAYQMKAEVGECFIAPVFEALRRRNVKFRFLHELREIVPDAAGTQIERLIFDVPKLPGPPGAAEAALQAYDPLDEFSLSGGAKRVYWPPEPKSPFAFVGRIEIDRPHPLRPCGLPREQVNRELGTHFDRVVFALPHGVVPRVAPQLVAQKPAWRDLADLLPTVETKSLRLWLNTAFADLKWDSVVPAERPVLSAYDPLFSTWEDSGQQLSLHTWPSNPPKSIATVFGPLQAGRYPPRSRFCEWLHEWLQRQRARSEARGFLKGHVPGLWPGLIDGSGVFKWNELVPVELPPDGLLQQWVVANCGARERYTHAAPGTFGHRLRSSDTGYSNLSVAGEWTRFWPATANVELAVISGLRAAYDLRGLSNVTIPSERGFFPG